MNDQLNKLTDADVTLIDDLDSLVIDAGPLRVMIDDQTGAATFNVRGTGFTADDVIAIYDHTIRVCID